MTPANTANIILPSWRQGRLLFFVSVTDAQTTRLDYRVAAGTAPNSTQVFRTNKAPISNEDLENCQKTADSGATLQLFFDTVSRGNLDALTALDGKKMPTCANGTNALIYICSYFNFLRKYSVDQALVTRYEAQSPEARFQIENALSIYRILSAHLQPNRAVTLINADIPDINKVLGAKNQSANLLREVALIQYDSGDYSAAIKTMHRAIELHNTQNKWRRLADFAIAANKPEKAIEYYFEAEKMAELAPPQAIRMARLLVNSDQRVQAKPFLDRAEKQFEAQVKNLRAKLDDDAKKN